MPNLKLQLLHRISHIELELNELKRLVAQLDSADADENEAKPKPPPKKKKSSRITKEFVLATEWARKELGLNV